jgi:glycosyltransferase involved in cell wall biosynthesis
MKADELLGAGATRPVLSIVAPAFNEQDGVERFHARLGSVLRTLGCPAEIVYVNDGSTDDTQARLEKLRIGDPRVGIVELSRNFGKEAAMTAGLDAARGDAVIVIDVDLQDPPELIPRLVEEWQRGFDIVQMRRAKRPGESAFKRVCAWVHYRLLNLLSSAPIPVDVGDFRLMSRRAVDAMRLLPERNRYMKGLFAWIGFRQRELVYERAPRVAGATKWPLARLLSLSFDGITAFSTAPLRLASALGAAIAGLSFVFAAWVVTKTLLFGEPVRGFPTLMVTVLFLGGAQLLAIGILGEYLGRMFVETKQRPIYLVNRVLPAGEADDRSERSDPIPFVRPGL